eukprot:gene3032-3313_t
MVREVPTIDISGYDDPVKRQEIAAELFEVARSVGFFYITGHGIPEREIEQAFATGQRFLDLGASTKTKYPFNPDSYLGYRGFDELATITDKEFKEITVDFIAKTHDVALKILKMLAMSLGWDPAIIDEAWAMFELRQCHPFDFQSEENASYFMWNHYPPVDQALQEQLRKKYDGKLPPRVHAHADMGVLTILYQRPGDVGLEIAPGNEVEGMEKIIADVASVWNQVPVAQEWTPVDPKPGCLTVNIGDALTRWTDGQLKSTYHRVRTPTGNDPQGPRYSMPYFVNPKLHYVIQGSKKLWEPVTGFELLSKTGNAYVARKSNPDKSWLQNAFIN